MNTEACGRGTGWRRGITISFVVLSLGAISVITVFSLVPSGYFFYRAEDSINFVPDPLLVSSAFVLPTLEAAGVLAIVRPWSFSWSWHRALVALAVYSGWLKYCSSMIATHIPIFLMLNVAWVAVIVFLLTCLLAITGGVMLRRRGRQGSELRGNRDQVV